MVLTGSLLRTFPSTDTSHSQDIIKIIQENKTYMEYTHANPMKKLILPTSIALLLLPCLSLLLLAVTVKANTQYVVPCSFNPMCSCKMSQSSLMVKRDDYLREMDLQNRTSSELAADAGTQKESRLEDDMSTVMKSGSMEQAFDVSCVGVPFAFLPGTRALTALIIIQISFSKSFSKNNYDPELRLRTIIYY